MSINLIQERILSLDIIITGYEKADKISHPIQTDRRNML